MSEKTHIILALNPGSTSTKLAVYESESCLFERAVQHEAAVLEAYAGRPVLSQRSFRAREIRTALAAAGTRSLAFDAVAGRGGLLRPLESGTYVVTDRMLADLREARRGEHASNLGAFLAREMAEECGCPAFVVDPVSVDEWPPVARLSGLQGLDRECLSHALNTKAVARRYAAATGKSYSSCRLVIVHLGSGVTVSAHENGRMIDATNSREEGAFSTERAGSLPTIQLVARCFSGHYTQRAIERMIFGEGGIYSYLHTKDLQEVQQQIDAGDRRAALVFDALIYQISKGIGCMAAVLAGEVEAILLTGGMAHHAPLVRRLEQQVRWIAPVRVYPGENELEALALGALRVLRGEEKARRY